MLAKDKQELALVDVKITKHVQGFQCGIIIWKIYIYFQVMFEEWAYIIAPNIAEVTEQFYGLLISIENWICRGLEGDALQANSASLT